MNKILVVALLGILSVNPVYADGRGDRGGRHGGGWDRGSHSWRGDWILPALITGAIIYDVSRPRTVYVEPDPVYVWEPPQTMHYESEHVYIDQPETVYERPVPDYSRSYSAPDTPPPPAPNWYYCAAANAYYPYVSSCPEGWQEVPSTPPDFHPQR